MSWMDSWSRPGKHAAVPPPVYLTEGDVPYCHTCGRVMSSRKSQKRKANIIKYCSDRCRNRKLGTLDRKIDQKILSLLSGEAGSGIESTKAKSRVVKGDPRIVVTCGEIEELVFGSRHDPNKVFGRRKNRASRVIGGEDGEWKSVDMIDDSDSSSSNDEDPTLDYTHPNPSLNVRPPQTVSDVNGSIGGEKGWAERQGESAEDLQKRLEGQRRAEEREMVRRAARRAVVFGFVVDSQDTTVPGHKAEAGLGKSQRKDDSSLATIPDRRKCEAIMNGAVVGKSNSPCSLAQTRRLLMSRRPSAYQSNRWRVKDRAR